MQFTRMLCGYHLKAEDRVPLSRLIVGLKHCPAVLFEDDPAVFGSTLGGSGNGADRHLSWGIGCVAIG
jgi:hypothetical protein